MFDVALAALLASSFLALLRWSGRLSFIEPEFSGALRRIAAFLALWTILIVAVFYPTVTSTGGSAIDLSQMPFPTLFVGHALLVAFLLLWWFWRNPIPISRFLFVQRPTVADLRSGFAYGALAWILGIAASAAVGPLLQSGDLPSGLPEIPPTMVWLAGLPLAHKLATIAIAMTVEEGFFRAFLQSRIGWFASSVLFALGHAGYGMPRLVISVFAVSLVFGHAFRRNGRILPCMIAHGVFDAVQLLVVIPFAVEMMKGAA
jgi:membrane protease YdiL (CAAX protease family)